MRAFALLSVGVVLCACSSVKVESENPPTDFNEDGKIGFSDLERGRPTEPMVDFDRSFADHMEKQSADYERRMRDD